MLSDNLGPRALCISSIISRKLAVQRLFITRASTRTVKCAFFFGTEEDFTFRRGGEVKQSCIPHLVVQCDSRHRKCVLDISLSLLHVSMWVSVANTRREAMPSLRLRRRPLPWFRGERRIETPEDLLTAR